jgi:hypothetical protein
MGIIRVIGFGIVIVIILHPFDFEAHPPGYGLKGVSVGSGIDGYAILKVEGC